MPKAEIDILRDALYSAEGVDPEGQYSSLYVLQHQLMLMTSLMFKMSVDQSNAELLQLLDEIIADSDAELDAALSFDATMLVHSYLQKWVHTIGDMFDLSFIDNDGRSDLNIDNLNTEQLRDLFDTMWVFLMVDRMYFAIKYIEQYEVEDASILNDENTLNTVLLQCVSTNTAVAFSDLKTIADNEEDAPEISSIEDYVSFEQGTISLFVGLDVDILRTQETV